MSSPEEADPTGAPTFVEGGPDTPEVDDTERVPKISRTHQLGRYVITGQLGAGGMGEVVEIRDPTLERSLAAKLIRRDANELLRAKFVQEARVTGQLEHPNIVPVHELEAEGDQPFYTMKQIRGKTLDELMAEEDRQVHPGAWPDRETLVRRLRIFLKICDAISLAHARRIVHRDLKPPNIMVGEFGEVLVVDWGLAKRLGSAESLPAEQTPDEEYDPLATRQGSVMGTPAYMPPEQARGDVDEVDERADVYALGAILYQMLAGVPPVDGRTAKECLAAVREGRIVPPSRRAPRRTIPWELEAVTLKATAAAAAARYLTVGALRGDIEAWLGNRELLAAHYGPLTRVGRWLARRWRGLAAAVAIVALVLTGWWAQHSAAARAVAEARAEHEALQAERQRVLARLQTEISSVRLARYVPEIDYPGLIRPVHEAIGELATLLRDPLHASHAPNWIALADGRLFVEDLLGCASALNRAEKLGATSNERWIQLTVRLHMSKLIVLGRLEAPQGHGLRGELARRAALHIARVKYWLDRTEVRDGLQGAALTGFELVVKGQSAEAEKHGRAALKRHSGELGSEQLWLVVALAARDQGHLDAQDVACVQALRRCPQLVWANLMRGVRPGAEHADAERHLDRALAIAPRRVPVLLARGNLRVDMGKSEQAMADFDLAVKIDPTDAMPLVYRAIARSRMGASQGAAEDLTAALKRFPDDDLVLLNRAAIYARSGRLDEAEADFRRLIELAPHLDHPHYGVAMLTLERGDLPAARKAIDALMRAKPRSALIHLAHGHLAVAEGRYADALTAFRRGADRKKPSAELAHVIGQTLLRMGRLAEARAMLDRAIAIDPLQRLAWRDRAIVRSLRGDHEGALKDHDRALTLAPRDSKAYGNRARTLAELGRIDDALKDLDRGLKIDPKDGELWFNRALLLLAKKRPTEGLRDLDTALRLLKRGSEVHVQAMVNRGRALMALGRHRESWDQLQAALPFAGPHRGSLESLIRKAFPGGKPK